MNAFPMALAWCVLQVTLLATIAMVWYGLLRRAGPGARSLALFTGLSLIVLLTLLSVSPWPRWPEWSLSRASPPAMSAPTDVSASTVKETSGAASPPAVTPPDSPPLVMQFWNALADEVRSQTRPVVRDQWTWPVVLAALMVVGAGFGFGRLCLGLLLVRSYRLRSRLISAPEVLELRDVLQAELGCRRSIELYESDSMATAATVGWKKPLVILPTAWRSWTPAERTAVLAHEIAHIQRHDFFTWVAAQVALVLHFYHPFVHWLCGRLRLEQELAADAAAARLSGGQQTYLTTLAAMALRQADRPLAWPARTFLPTRGTFMRRIEMLRDSRLPAATLSTGMRVATVGVLLMSGLFVAGFRGTAGMANAESGTLAFSAAGAAIGAAEPASLAYVPRDAVIVATARPIDILARPEFGALRKALEQQGATKTPFGVGLDRVEQFTLVMLPHEVAPNVTAPTPAGFILRTSGATDIDSALKTLVPDSVELEYATQKYIKRSSGPPTCAMRVDDRTLVFCESEEYLKRMIVAGGTGASTTKWADAWKTVSRNDAALLINVAALRTSLDAALQQPNPGAALLLPLAPLWQKSDTVAVSLQLGQELKLLGTLTCPSSTDAAKVQETLSAAVTLLKNSLSQGRASAARMNGGESATLLGLLDIGDSMLDGAKVNVSDKKVELTATVAAKELATLGTLVVPAVGNARSAARRAQSMNNLKQIGLAMHNYAASYPENPFPPAVLYGPDGKTPYSWRVALLPYLGEDALFRQYNFNEPWDSENNKKVLEKMPVVYRDPSDEGPSKNASYFVLTGPDTIFSGKDGTKIAQITDGTSNTILTVEAKRDIPWTKPEDIPYERGKALPKLGGHHDEGFIAGFADGSVRFIAKAIDEKVLRMLFTKSGGEVIPQY